MLDDTDCGEVSRGMVSVSIRLSGCESSNFPRPGTRGWIVALQRVG
jgi:hypothetical protein